MTPGVVRVALRRAVREVRYVEVVRARRAKGLVGRVYRQIEQDFGMLAPPVALHAAAPPVLAAAWAMLRESLIAGGAASRAHKEVVATSVSEGNACPYCVEVHGMTLGSLGSSVEAALIESGEYAAIEDTDTRELARWVRGDGPLPDGVSSATAAELTAVAVVFHYLNRMVNVFLGPSPLPPAVPASARPKVRDVLGRFLKPGTPPKPGAALELLPEPTANSPLWMDENSVTADAFARAGETITVAADWIPPDVRRLVTREVAAWDGRPPGLSRAWLEPVLAELPGDERPAARLALLVAKAAYQVGADDVRDSGLEDRALIELTAWASFTAAAELGSRLRHGAARRVMP
ncbi:carboxymuconolactone decarboxylase family protein [Amycolatopsis sp. NPDC059021]|uniref:carboxymuconolactone decarboxylase family protein n=1 Tax=Amycolatopsis sp. NPDC059021 TaxID=3346704 RepID=UPI00367006C0